MVWIPKWVAKPLQNQTFECSKVFVCDLVCLMPDKLEYHQSMHNQVKRFGCEPCGKALTTVYDEGRHKKYNCPNNPNQVFKCKHCVAKGLPDPDIEGAESGLMNHLTAQHRMAGAYLCLYCHKLFVTDTKLSKHNKTCSKNHPDKHGWKYTLIMQVFIHKLLF